MIIVFDFLSFIAIPYCSQVASSVLIICWSCCSLCQHDCVICISDVCDILSIYAYSLSVLQCFSYQVFRVNVEQTRWQYTTLSNASLYCNFFRWFNFISHCGFLLEVKICLVFLFLCLVLRLSIGSKQVMLNSVKCLGVINETNVLCFLHFLTYFHHYSHWHIASLVPLPALNPYWLSLSGCSMIGANLFLIRFNTIVDVCLLRLMVLWSSHLTAFEDFGNELKCYSQSQAEVPHCCRLSGLSQLWLVFLLPGTVSI